MIEHRQIVECGGSEIITEFTYKNHKYIAIQEGFGYYAWGGIVHDPDCPCHTDTLYLTDTLQIDTLKH